MSDGQHTAHALWLLASPSTRVLALCLGGPSKRGRVPGGQHHQLAGVEFDYRDDVIDAHSPEMPTRFAKQLAQIVRGGVAMGFSRKAAMKLANRCARDSMPPLGLAIIDYLAEYPNSFTADVRKGIDKPHTSSGAAHARRGGLRGG